MFERVFDGTKQNFPLEHRLKIKFSIRLDQLKQASIDRLGLEKCRKMFIEMEAIVLNDSTLDPLARIAVLYEKAKLISKRTPVLDLPTSTMLVGSPHTLVGQFFPCK